MTPSFYCACFIFRKLNHVLTNRLIKFFQEQAKKDPARYNEFYEDYGLYIREGILTTPEQETRVGLIHRLQIFTRHIFYSIFPGLIAIVAVRNKC